MVTFSSFYLPCCYALTKYFPQLPINIFTFEYAITPFILHFCHPKRFNFINDNIKIPIICKLHAEYLQLIKSQCPHRANQSQHL